MLTRQIILDKIFGSSNIIVEVNNSCNVPEKATRNGSYSNSPIKVLHFSNERLFIFLNKGFMSGFTEGRSDVGCLGTD